MMRPAESGHRQRRTTVMLCSPTSGSFFSTSSLASPPITRFQLDIWRLTFVERGGDDFVTWSTPRPAESGLVKRRWTPLLLAAPAIAAFLGLLAWFASRDGRNVGGCYRLG